MIFAHFTQSGRQLCLHQKQLPSLSTGMILGAEEWQMVSGYGGPYKHGYGFNPYIKIQPHHL